MGKKQQAVSEQHDFHTEEFARVCDHKPFAWQSFRTALRMRCETMGGGYSDDQACWDLCRWYQEFMAGERTLPPREAALIAEWVIGYQPEYLFVAFTAAYHTRELPLPPR